jgi:hypothetical protein
LVAINGYNDDDDDFLCAATGALFCPEFGSVRAWLPFEYASQRKTNIPGGARRVWALVNCNTEDLNLFGQVATLVSDNHGRSGVDQAHMSISEYLFHRSELGARLHFFFADTRMPPPLVTLVAAYVQSPHQYLASLRQTLGQNYCYGRSTNRWRSAGRAYRSASEFQ